MEEADREDLTRGSVWKKILFFALPLLVSSLIQQMYSTVDLMIAGNFLGNEASAALGSSSSMIFAVTTFFEGMSVGAGIVMAEAIGSKKHERVHSLVHTVIGLGVLLGIIVALIGEGLIPVYLKTMNLPSEIYLDSKHYVQIYFISTFPMVMFNMAAAIIRASGNSLKPMSIQFIGGSINIIMDLILVVVMHDVVAVALASVISQVVPMYLALHFLTKTKGDLHLTPSQIRIDRRLAGSVLHMGIPAGVQAMAMSVSNLIVQFYINKLGLDTISAFTAYYRVESFVYYPLVSIGQAVTTFTGQNRGAGNYERVRKGFRMGLVLGMIATMGLAGLMLLMDPIPYRWFNTDRTVIALAGKIGAMIFPLYWIDVFLEITADFIRGMGKPFISMVAVLTCICLLRVVLLPFFEMIWNDYRGIAILYPLTWTCTAIVLLICYSRMKREEKMIHAC